LSIEQRNDQSAAALLLIGHGTRNAAGTGQFLALAAYVAAQLAPVRVEPAFLELAEPTIEQAIERLAVAGVRQVVVVPLLLFAAGHAKRDIPAAIAAAAARRGMTTIQTEPLACEAQILKLSHLRYEEAITEKAAVLPEETCLLLVGRGSKDDSATAAMHEFARLRQEREGTAVEVAFLAMAEPPLADQLSRLAASGYRRIVVQPHLLFQGELASSLAEQVAVVAARNSLQGWLLAPLLADLAGAKGAGTGLLGNVISERYRSATIRVVAPAGEH
jgi:sirohydrochlorin cobaltochelatase